MRFAFTPDQLLFRDAVRDVLSRECPPSLVRAVWDDRHAGDALWGTLAAQGTLGLTVPEAHGGMGLGALDAILIFEELGRFAAPLALEETMGAGAPLVAQIGGASFKARWLPAIARGEARVALVSSAGSLARDADVADLLLVREGGAVHAATRASVALEARPPVDRSQRLFHVSLKPGAARDTFHGEAAALDAAFDRAALCASAELLGLAARMVEMTVDYAKVRKQFGSAIGAFQAVKHPLASALVKIELSRPAVVRAAVSIDASSPDASMHASMAKVCASEAATFAARVALQAHGAIGYSFEHDLHLWMKRAWTLAASFGDPRFHRARVARAVLDDVVARRVREARALHLPLATNATRRDP